jgi:hypothetical protein
MDVLVVQTLRPTSRVHRRPSKLARPTEHNHLPQLKILEINWYPLVQAFVQHGRGSGSHGQHRIIFRSPRFVGR